MINIRAVCIRLGMAVMVSVAAIASAQSIVIDTAKVPFEVNVAATIKAIKSGEITSKAAAANTAVIVAVPLVSFVSSGAGDGGGDITGVLNGARKRVGATATVSGRDGKVVVRLSAQSYKNADISLYAINGKRVSRNRVVATDAVRSIARRNLTAGIYLLSINGSDGSVYTSRVTHRGGSLDINVAFLNETLSHYQRLAKESAAMASGAWYISVSAAGYDDSIFSLNLTKGDNPKQNITLRSSKTIAKTSFTETLSANASLDMVYIPGGTFTIGCEKSSGCPANTTPVSGVKVSNYFIGKGEVTNDQWFAVMGWYIGYDIQSGGNKKKTTKPESWDKDNSVTTVTWYEAIDFACKLSQKTGKKYRMVTEAEWEYAAKNHLSSLKNIGAGEEWAYNTWNSAHMGGTDPIGPNGSLDKLHTQKTRRDAENTGDNITGRLIRSIEGVGPALRLAISADMDYPPGMPSTCDIRVPELDDEPENSYRDMRWVTGSDKKWATPAGANAIGSFDLRVWEDGTASFSASNYMGGTTVTSGQWFTSNNIAFVFVPSSGSIRPYKYIFVTLKDASLICDMDYMNGGYTGRIIKEEATHVDKPTISGGLKSGAELAAAAGADYKMIDMVNIPASAKTQDERLLDGPSQGWFQDNRTAGGVHHYRKDVDADEFRFTVNQAQSIILTNGSWFTVNKTFLRVTHSGGYTTDYLYAVTGTGADATFYHNSFQGYERGDFRMFKKTPNKGEVFAATCGTLCDDEIKKGQNASLYATSDNGKSTFVPAKCPSGGCK